MLDPNDSWYSEHSLGLTSSIMPPPCPRQTYHQLAAQSFGSAECRGSSYIFIVEWAPFLLDRCRNWTGIYRYMCVYICVYIYIHIYIYRYIHIRLPHTSQNVCQHIFRPFADQEPAASPPRFFYMLRDSEPFDVVAVSPEWRARYQQGCDQQRWGFNMI